MQDLCPESPNFTVRELGFCPRTIDTAQFAHVSRPNCQVSGYGQVEQIKMTGDVLGVQAFWGVRL